MIKEAYCSYKVAKLLKEKGFNGLCSACFDPNDKSFKTIYYNTSGEVEPQDWNNLSRREAGKIGLATWYGYISAPTLQMAMAWLREKNISIELSVVKPHYWVYTIYKILSNKVEELHNDGGFDSYEEGVESALKYYIENFI